LSGGSKTKIYSGAAYPTLISSTSISVFGEMGANSLAFEAVLEGTFTPPVECTPHMCKVLVALKRPRNIENIET